MDIIRKTNPLNPILKANRLMGASLMIMASCLHAEVKCPPVLGSHMVLQRDRPVAIWGTAEPGEGVEVSFGSVSATTRAGADGAWKVEIGPFSASARGRLLRVKGSNELRFEDVLVGEVWLCSGQSNMEQALREKQGQLPVNGANEEIRKADHPLLRLYQVPRNGQQAAGDLTLQWHVSKPETLEKLQFSAAGYLFGAGLLEALEVPVGVIHSSFGGSRIEPWTPRDAYAGIPGLENLARAAATDGKVGNLLIGGNFDTMIKPLVPYAVRGFLWYQGETNLINGDGLAYTPRMRALIEGWRKAWATPDAPFYFVQLAPYLYSERDRQPRLSADALPLFWEAQTRALEIPNTRMAVITDTVTDYSNIHPPTKHPVGERLTKIALSCTYGRKIEDSGPVFKGMTISGARALLAFDHAKGLESRDGEELREFQIAGEDRVFHPAKSTITKGRVVVSSPAVDKPVAVRYCWNERANPNLHNGDGLPAPPFRTDDWPVSSTEPPSKP
jgi:sialate O-acetylesterase